MDQNRVISVLNKALEHEMSMMVRYLHHSFIVTGTERGHLVEFFRGRVNASAQIAISLGEKITALGGHPSVTVSEIYEPGDQTIGEMLNEDLEQERANMELYEGLLRDVRNNIAMKAYLEQFICQEQRHIDELDMYLRSP